MFLFDNPTALINYIFCFVISVVAFIYYKKNKEQIFFYISFAFYFLGFTHFAILTETYQKYFLILLILRICANNFMVIGLLKVIQKKFIIPTLINFALASIAIYFYYLNVISQSLLISSINLYYYIIILLLSFLLYKKQKSKIALYLIMSYTFFAIAAIASLFNINIDLTRIIIWVVALGYSIVFIMFMKLLITDALKLIKQKFK